MMARRFNVFLKKEFLACGGLTRNGSIKSVGSTMDETYKTNVHNSAILSKNIGKCGDAILPTKGLFDKVSKSQFHSCAVFAGGSGYGGSIRSAGGAFGEMEKAKEDQYFYNLQKDQLKRLKEDSKKKIKYHREQIEKHEEAIKKEEDKFKDRQG